jgi:hypothetical protein
MGVYSNFQAALKRQALKMGLPESCWWYWVEWSRQSLPLDRRAYEVLQHAAGCYRLLYGP